MSGAGVWSIPLGSTPILVVAPILCGVYIEHVKQPNVLRALSVATATRHLASRYEDCREAVAAWFAERGVAAV